MDLALLGFLTGRARAGLAIGDIAGRVRRGRLDLTFPDGARRRFEGVEPGPEAWLVLHRPRVFRRFLARGAVGFAESYIDGDWDSPDLAGLLELFDRNHGVTDGRWSARGPGGWLLRLRHQARANTRGGSRRNIRAHYDLGNEFYAAWLDPSLTYSSALFEPGTASLEAAQAAKYRRLAETIGLGPGQSLLEIGSGWGGFALTAAKEFGARVTSITISREQQELAARRVHEEGLADRVEIRLEDYRDTVGRFDKVASIEMFEAVGQRYWSTFFDRLRARLAPGGTAGLQVITIADRYFEAYRQNVDFIQSLVFPGGMLPSMSVLDRVVAEAGLVRTGGYAFGASYARTLGEWHRRFEAAWPTLLSGRFDERFRRLWRFYLAYCEAAFRTGSTDVWQLALRHA